MVILEVVTALENLALMEGLRQEADVYRVLLNRSQEAIVVATEKGLIYAATAAGRTLLSRAENGEKGALVKQSEQRVPAEISSAAGLGEEIAFHGVTIKGTKHGDPELTEPVIVYQLCESQADMTVDVETVAGKLTPMQTQVLRLLLRGLQYKEIASRLGNSANTVHHHVSEILRRLSCADRIELLTRFQPKHELPTASKEPVSLSPVPQTRLIVDFPQPPKKLRLVPDNRPSRPVTFDTLKALLLDCRLMGNCLVWRKGFKTWTPVTSVNCLVPFVYADELPPSVPDFAR
jgi:DNA-binding NarL/FixJ family response regulator